MLIVKRVLNLSFWARSHVREQCADTKKKQFIAAMCGSFTLNLRFGLSFFPVLRKRDGNRFDAYHCVKDDFVLFLFIFLVLSFVV